MHVPGSFFWRGVSSKVMSCLLGPFDSDGSSEKTKNEEQLLVFGYACKLFRDDARTLLESSGQLLIPWMGDNSLMVDRYDVRNKLEDKSQFGVKSSLPQKLSIRERELDEELDEERYLALHCDDIRVEEQEEEERRRASENSLYSAIGFSYNEQPPPPDKAPPIPPIPPPVERARPPPVVHEGEEFVLPQGLVVPEGIILPATQKLHSVIQKTAGFVSQQGVQMEIIIKSKQQSNPLFSFLNIQDLLYPYYYHLKTVLGNGSYVPTANTSETQQAASTAPASTIETKSTAMSTAETHKTESTGAAETPETQSTAEAANTEKSDNKEPDDKTSDSHSEAETVDSDLNDENSDSEDDGYLHPLLMQTMTSRSKSSTPTPTVPLTTREATPPPSFDVPTLSAVTFRAKSMVVNPAPVPRQKVVEPPPPDLEASAPVATSNGMTHNNSSMYAGPPASYVEPHPHYHEGAPPPPPPPHDPHYSHTPPTGGYDFPQDPYYMTNTYQPPPVNSAPFPPPDLQAIIDKTAAYVAKNGEGFESTVIKRHLDDPRFGFLNPWGQYYDYYHQQKLFQLSCSQNELTIPMLTDKRSLQKLSSSGAISFRVQSKAPPKLLSDGGQFEELLFVESVPEPPTKKARVESVGMGSTVQQFLSTVKDMFH